MRIQLVNCASVALVVLGTACGAVSDNDDGGDGDGPDANLGAAQLSSLELAGYQLDPPFDPAVTTYSATGAFFVDEVSVTAAAPAEHFIRIDNSAVDSGVASDPIELDLGANSVSVEVMAFEKETTNYTINVQRGREVLEYVKASNAEANDLFGLSMAMSGDLLVVGAPSEDSAAVGVNGDQNDNTASSAGAVYVFAKVDGGWVQEAYIKPAVSDAADSFGRKVAIDGDTLVVATTSEDSDATGIDGDAVNDNALSSGAAWVFVRSQSGTWSQQAYLKASNTAQSDIFGDAIAISGDTIAVSATGEDSSATGVGGDQSLNDAPSSGAVYVFFRQNGVWGQQAYIKASNTQTSDLFGQALALEGDTLVVGADGEDSDATGIDGDQSNDDATSAGAVYVFTRNGALWSQQAYIKSSNAETSDVFGRGLSLSGDTLIVSAEGEDSGANQINGNQADNEAPSAGAAYVFTRVGGQWSQEAYLKASNPSNFDVFGSQVLIDGDTAVVSARLEDSAAAGIDANQADGSATNAGAAYIFRRVAGEWRQTNYVKSKAPNAGDEFGLGLGMANDMIVVSAGREDGSSTGVGGDANDNSANNAGAVYVFE